MPSGGGSKQTRVKNTQRSLAQLLGEENIMLKWMKELPSSHVLGWIGAGVLAIVIVLVFVRRLVG